MDGIPSCNNPRTADGEYFRKLFKYTGLILIKLEYNDLGAINAERLKTQIKMEPIDEKEIQQQGYVAYQLLYQIIKEGDFDYKKVHKALSPILSWYRKKYSKYGMHDSTGFKKIDDIEKILQEETLYPEKLNNFKPIKQPLESISDNEDENNDDAKCSYKEKDLLFDYEIHEEEEENDEKTQVEKVQESLNEPMKWVPDETASVQNEYEKQIKCKINQKSKR